MKYIAWERSQHSTKKRQQKKAQELYLPFNPDPIEQMFTQDIDEAREVAPFV